jgi:hypothetical protein
VLAEKCSISRRRPTLVFASAASLIASKLAVTRYPKASASRVRTGEPSAGITSLARVYVQQEQSTVQAQIWRVG